LREYGDKSGVVSGTIRQLPGIGGRGRANEQFFIRHYPACRIVPGSVVRSYRVPLSRAG